MYSRVTLKNPDSTRLPLVTSETVLNESASDGYYKLDTDATQKRVVLYKRDKILYRYVQHRNSSSGRLWKTFNGGNYFRTAAADNKWHKFGYYCWYCVVPNNFAHNIITITIIITQRERERERESIRGRCSAGRMEWKWSALLLRRRRWQTTNSYLLFKTAVGNGLAEILLAFYARHTIHSSVVFTVTVETRNPTELVFTSLPKTDVD